jgi:ATP synthase I chain
MAEPDSIYGAAERRIEWFTLALGIAAAVFASMKWGWRSGAGVALGTALTWLNFRLLKQAVGVLVRVSTAQAGSEHARVPLGVYLKFFAGFALLLVVVYVILSRSLLPMAAVLGGLFAVVVAIMVELLFELVSGERGAKTHS